MATMIHGTAIVDPNAQLGEGVSIGAYSVIGADVQIGDNTTIANHVTIEGPTTVGQNNHIYQYNSIGAAPQDKKYAGEPTTLTIGDGNTIREFCTFNRGTVQDLGDTKIGNDNWIMAYVHVAHDCVISDHTIIANNTSLAGHVNISDWVILGGFTQVHQFITIGAHAFTGFGSGLTKDVPAYVTTHGHPAKPAGINSEGLRRRGFTSEQIMTVKRAYRTLYREGLRLEEALSVLKEKATDAEELEVLIASLEQSTRGIIR